MKMGEQEHPAAILIMKAAAEIRKAAAIDKKRAVELSGVADYLESIIYEAELGYGDPLFPEAEEPSPGLPEDEIKKKMKPFRVRLSR